MEMIFPILLISLLLLGTILNYGAEKTWCNLLQLISVIGFILSLGILGLTFNVNVPPNSFILFLQYMAHISLIVFIIGYLTMTIQNRMIKKSAIDSLPQSDDKS